MKKLLLILFLCFACTIANKLTAQSLDFKNTVYYTAVSNALTSSGQSLGSEGFDYSSAAASHPIFNGGIFFPVVDFQGNNIWVKVTHIAADPNGTAVGANIPATCSDPFRAGFGGWGGFLYQFEIYKDAALIGIPSNTLDGLFPSNISVESIETLSAGEWLSFELLNAESNNWALNSINFTGSNPGSNPGFSAVNIPWPGSQPPPGFSTTFPASSKNIYVVDYGGGSYAEFKMSAENVSKFNYGYEYTGGCGGYQGMNLSFGNKVIPRVGIAVSQGGNPGCAGSLQEFTATPVNAGTSPSYQWKKNGIDVPSATGATYSSTSFATGDVITCVMTTSLNVVATSNSITILTPLTASTWYLDADGDQYYTGSPVVSCTSPGTGYTTTVIAGGDCKDDNINVHPGAVEICGNGIDDNCNGQIDENCAGTQCDNNLHVTTGQSGVQIGKLDIGGNQLTIEATFKRTDPYIGGPLYAGDLVSKHSNQYDCNYLLRPNGVAIATVNGFSSVDIDCEIELNKTYHVAMVYDGTTLKFYRNGVLKGSSAASGNLITNNFITAIGSCAFFPNNFNEDFKGFINEVRFWNIARTQAEINQYITTSLPNPQTQTGLLAYYQFNDLLNKQGNATWNASILGNATINATNPDCTNALTDICILYTFYKDADGDTYGDPAISVTNYTGIAPTGFVTNNTDCDDTKAAINPATVWYKDADNDGYSDGATLKQCLEPVGYKLATNLTATSGDCKDALNAVHPGATEICGNGIDDNCDGQIDEGCTLYTFYKDADGDTYGDPASFITNYTGVVPEGYVNNKTDCDDTKPTVHPGAVEICGNGIDDNCNGQIDEGCTLYTFYKDADGDTYGNPLLSVTNYTGVVPAGYVNNKTDCDDTKPTVHPGAVEICGNGIDDNCNGQIDEGCTGPITVSICDASITEGNCGTKLLCFAVNLSQAAIATSTVKYKTSNGTAMSTSDYKAADATITFAAGQSVKYVCVVINGDYKIEQNETFYVTLYSPVNLVLGNRKTATGTIINDDKCGSREAGITSKFGEEPSILNVPTLLRRSQQLKIPNLPANNKVMLYNANGRLMLNTANYSNNANLSNMAAGMYYYNIIITNKEGMQEMFKGKIVIMD